MQRPCGAIFAQELFESRLIPGETDYRIFRDYGKIPGARLLPLFAACTGTVLESLLVPCVCQVNTSIVRVMCIDVCCVSGTSNFGLPLVSLFESSHQ